MTELPSSVSTFDNKTEFVRAFHARREAAHAIWDHLTPNRTVVLEVSEHWLTRLCGGAASTNREHHAIVATLQRDTGPGGAYLLRNGAAARELYRLIQKRDRMATRLPEAWMKVVDEDPSEIERVVETLNQRLEQRDVATSFDEEWLPRRAASSTLARVQSPVSNATSTRQTTMNCSCPGP